MEEIVFLVEERVEGGYLAKCPTVPIFTEAETIDALRIRVKDAVHCHFEDAKEMPKMIRLHFVKDEVFAAWEYRDMEANASWLMGPMHNLEPVFWVFYFHNAEA